MTKPGQERIVTIRSVGSHGDGVANEPDGPLFVPDAAPGDVLRVSAHPDGGSRAAKPLELIEAGSGRAEPVCRHFGPCGGCRLQHVNGDTYLAWKRDQVVHALAQRDLGKVPVDATIACPPGSRRRVRMAARRIRQGILLGFNERASHRIVDIGDCPIAHPDIVAALPALRAVLAEIVPEGTTADISITVLADGIDLVLHGPTTLDLATRQVLAQYAGREDLARLSWAPSQSDEAEPLAHRRPGELVFGAIRATVPPGGFLQASAQGESALIDLVGQGVGDARAVADLYCGIGTFALSLAQQPGRSVLALDGDAQAIAALNRTLARSPGLAGRVDGQLRNLRRRPVTPEQLNRYDAVVLDPPRHGAQQQANALAQSTVARVVGVSCNPISFARDARILVDGGYRLDRVVPVDQFLWSTHIELVGFFHRD